MGIGVGRGISGGDHRQVAFSGDLGHLRHGLVAGNGIRGVAGYRRLIGQGRADGNCRVDGRPELQGRRSARSQCAVLIEIISGDDVASNADANRQTVQQCRIGNVGEVAGRDLIQIVGDRDIQRRHRSDVRNRHEIVEFNAGQERPTADHSHGFGNRHLLCVTHNDDRRLRAGCRITIAVSQDGRHFNRIDNSLVGNERTGRHAGIHHQVELYDGRGAGAQYPFADTRERRGQVSRADFNAVDKRRYAAVGLTERQTVQRYRIRYIGRVRRHTILQRRIGRRLGAVVVDLDRVPQDIAGIDDARRAAVDLQRRRLGRE